MIRHARIVLVAALALGAVAACSSPEERAAQYAAAAQKLYDAGELEKARLEASNALQIEPRNARARYVAALIAEQKRETSEMVGHLAVVIEVDPKNAPARVKLGTVLAFSQDYEGAAALADEALALTPDDPQAHVLKARVLLQKEATALAMTELGRAIELDPKNIDAALIRGLTLSMNEPEQGLADLTASIERIGSKETKALRQARVNVLFRLKRFDAIEQDLKSLAADFPNEDYQSRLALLYVEQKKMPEAEAVLKEAVAANPTSVAAKVALAQFQSKYREQPAEAEKTLKQFIAEDPENLQLVLMLGTFYDASNRLPDALGMYQKVADQSPISPEGLQARNQIAQIAVRNKDMTEARSRLDGILQDAPDNTQALLARGEINFAAGRNEDAISDLRAVLRKEPDSELGLLLLARTHVALGDRALATDAYRRLLQANPRQLDALVELAPLLADNAELDEAGQMLEQAIAIDPKSSSALSAIVDLLLARNDVAGAEVKARQLAALETPDGLGDRQLGRVLEAREQFPAAFQAYERSLERKPDSTLAFQGAVRSLLLAGKTGQATEFVRAHLERYPDHVHARVTFGEVLAVEGKYAEAREVLNEVITQRPDIATAYLTLAGAYPEDAAARIAALKRGREAAPKDAVIAMRLASEYERAGRFEDAIKAYEEVLQINPGLFQAVNSLASLLLDQRQDAASHKRALDLAQVFSTSVNQAFLDTLGWAYYVNGDNDSAVRYLELAVAYTAKPHPLVRYHLGMAYMASANAVGARQEFDKVLKETRPGSQGNEEAKLALAKLVAVGNK